MRTNYNQSTNPASKALFVLFVPFVLIRDNALKTKNFRNSGLGSSSIASKNLLHVFEVLAGVTAHRAALGGVAGVQIAAHRADVVAVGFHLAAQQLQGLIV